MVENSSQHTYSKNELEVFRLVLLYLCVLCVFLMAWWFLKKFHQSLLASNKNNLFSLEKHWWQYKNLKSTVWFSTNFYNVWNLVSIKIDIELFGYFSCFYILSWIFWVLPSLSVELIFAHKMFTFSHTSWYVWKIRILRFCKKNYNNHFLIWHSKFNLAHWPSSQN